MKMYRRGLIALSADPIHNGHIDLFRKASEICDNIIIYVTDNTEKLGSYVFSLPERVKLIKATGLKYKICSGNDPVVDVFLREGCDVLIRGIRSEKDRSYEDERMNLHRRLYSPLQVEYIYADYQYISSSLIKSLVYTHFDVSDMAPLVVKSNLEKKFHGHVLIGVTGGFCTGKTYICTQLMEHMKSLGVKAHHIDISTLIENLYSDTSPGSKVLRDQMSSLLGDGIVVDDQIDVNALMRVISQSDFSVVCKLHKMLDPYVHAALRKSLMDKQGLVLIEYPRMVEGNLTRFTNNVVIVVGAEKDFAPDDPMTIFKRRGEMSFDEKVESVRKKIRKDYYGRVIPMFISPVGGCEKDIEKLACELIQIFPFIY